MQMSTDQRSPGTSCEFPSWLLANVEQAMSDRGMSQTDIAAKLAGTADEAAMNREKVRVSRFLSGKNTTVETYQEIREILRSPKLPEWPPRMPSTEAEYLALAAMREQPADVVAVVASLRAVRQGRDLDETMASAERLLDAAAKMVSEIRASKNQK